MHNDMKYLLLLVITFSLCNGVSYSNELDNFIECKKIENNEERLKCYDSVKINEKLESSGIDGWNVQENRSKLDDKINISYIKESSNTLPNAIGRMETGSLIVRCSENSTEVYIIWPAFIGLRGNSVQYKIGNGNIIKENWITSTDGKAVFANKPIQLLKKLKDNKDFIIKLSPHGRNYEELEFDINGIDTVVDNISKYCNWKKD